ncbi:histidine phosphatase family protein [Pontibacter diazotrophicus]|uniref:Histidine phosphatase family protein n=1 Tax=Pontibacter diazotrophicus TaxID=1400979 RepID=A0A3D8L8N9_9BACT|nr:histidine phosphatase family protein [Pontibacter diazotrophicus]RDV13727.1 histidine phosphatase family protein [Pontibacter diazotrophicus]
METQTHRPHLPKRIFLIRHARPEVSAKGFFSAAAASQYISDYDAAQVEEFVLQHESIPYKEIKSVYCSTLIRSQLTAKAIFGEQVLLKVNHEFREFERKIFSLPFLRLPIKLWLVSARILWFMGFNSKGIETFKAAKWRARDCAEILAEDAHENATTVLVAHGLLNNFIRRELKRMGWHQTVKGGSGFVSLNVMEKD